MKLLLTVIKIIANIILFVVYTLVLITLVNFIFGFIMVQTGKVVPGHEDPIHAVLATISTGFVIFITAVLRKYFYFSLNCIGDTCKKVKQVEKVEIIEEKKVKKFTEQIKKQEKKSEDKIENEIEEEMKIFIDKEIK